MEKRVDFSEIQATLKQVLLHHQFTDEKAALSAYLFAKASLDGVPSHGLNRFLDYLRYVDLGWIIPTADPEVVAKFGSFERWNGHSGPGNLNAHAAMDAAISMAKSTGFGVVALQHTNHWMRAGNYGWQAVEAGCIGICFTNTKPNMPGWGGSEPKLGNNPLVVAIPRQNGPIVLDMAMSQFAYGKMAIHAKAGKEMPYDAGFDEAGNLSRSPSAIIEKEMALPIGLWKGAGLSLVLDMLAMVLSGGDATHEVGTHEGERGLSQVFLALDPKGFGLEEWMEERLDKVIQDLKKSGVFQEGDSLRYPGEQTLNTRDYNTRNGVPVDEDIWRDIKKYLHEENQG
ncbi:3-dehydro-L-gulonate 2-dehydrogenase [Echinicola vietnamensis]|uniref:Malate/lactate dehydrogenase n=1 Tax=Echinicola vietnamensis (strain DSM 17526 / LMG 23754 / KMM 6221) TaxID=926556 RepID=L0FZG6_ECHVK|nr:3-dehydro-L-gulonate 2-dehydrogenase [Echinicola vietnamensis]AGA79329.1 malate/lactate dehydrogenase [Echinicola vietnamensis DSM 17526]